MPYFVKSLAYIEEGSGAVRKARQFQIINMTLDFFNHGVIMPKANLMVCN